MTSPGLAQTEPAVAPIHFIDLQAQRARIKDRIDAAIENVLARGAFIMGPEVRELEARLAAFAGTKHCVTCSNGTDALSLALRALDIGAGDAVFVPAFTFAATAEVVALCGATPVFVDVLPDSFNIDPANLDAAIADVTASGDLHPRAVIPVDLFGQPADYRALARVAGRHRLDVIADAAQSFGATLDSRRVGTLGDLTTTSFFPAKPLGCYGDGGAVFTDDDAAADIMRSLRVHGKGSDKYDNVRIGLNARLDTLQAAILLEKLSIFPDEIEARQRVARRYTDALADLAVTPALMPGSTSVWAQYTLRLDGRDAIQAALKDEGIPTAIYYPMPLNRQTAYQRYPVAPGGTPVSDRHSRQVLSLPMHAYLEPDVQDRIIAGLRSVIQAKESD